MNTNVIVEITQNIAMVTLNRPNVHNAFDEEMIARLDSVFVELEARNDLMAVIVKGNGETFSAGADLGWMQRAADYAMAQNEVDARKLAGMLDRLYTLPFLTIACVQGAAIGGGLGLVCCCDVVLADQDAFFALSEVKLGLIPATIAPYVLAAIGPRQARRYFQTAERLSAQKALEIGLVHEVMQLDEMETQLQKIMSIIAKNGPQAMRAAKMLCLKYSGRTLDEDLKAETARAIAHVRASPEAKEGVSAFLEKRKPRW